MRNLEKQPTDDNSKDKLLRIWEMVNDPEDLELEDREEIDNLCDGLLARPFIELSLLELKILKDILEYRLKENEGLTEALDENNLSLLRQYVENGTIMTDEKVLQTLRDSLRKDEERAKSYPQDLQIIKGLIEKKEFDEGLERMEPLD